ncbi:MAG: response regulator transcription factor [Pseudomonadota bacterium]
MNSPNPKSQILIIDDDQELCAMLSEFLAPDSLEVSAVHSGEDGLEAIKEADFDLVILDIMLPGINGTEVLKQLRQGSDIPVVMLTARGDDVDRILGLEFGADDYLPKPFNPRELTARIKAILRRARQAPERDEPASVGELEVDLGTRRVSANGELIRLTGAEFELLKCLLETPSEVVSKDDLSQRALGRKNLPYDRSIDTHISNLRRKLSAAGVDNPQIMSRRGMGYYLAVES